MKAVIQRVIVTALLILIAFLIQNIQAMIII